MKDLEESSARQSHYVSHNNSLKVSKHGRLCCERADRKLLTRDSDLNHFGGGLGYLDFPILLAVVLSIVVWEDTLPETDLNRTLGTTRLEGHSATTMLPQLGRTITDRCGVWWQGRCDNRNLESMMQEWEASQPR